MALGVPCPPFPGNPLDPPLRSRFQARHISRVPAVSWWICWCLYTLRLGQASDGSGLFWCLLFYVDVVLWLFSCCWFVACVIVMDLFEFAMLWYTRHPAQHRFNDFARLIHTLLGLVVVPKFRQLFSIMLQVRSEHAVFFTLIGEFRSWKGWALIALRIPKLTQRKSW